MVRSIYVILGVLPYGDGMRTALALCGAALAVRAVPTVQIKDTTLSGCDVGIAVETTTPRELPLECTDDAEYDEAGLSKYQFAFYLSGRSGEAVSFDQFPVGTCKDHQGGEDQLMPSFSKTSPGMKSSIMSHYGGIHGNPSAYVTNPTAGPPKDFLSHFESPFEAPFAERNVLQAIEDAGYTCDDLTEPLGMYELMSHPIWDVVADMPVRIMRNYGDIVENDFGGEFSEFAAETFSAHTSMIGRYTELFTPRNQNPSIEFLTKDATYKDAYERFTGTKSDLCGTRLTDVKFSLGVPVDGGVFRYADPITNKPIDNVYFFSEVYDNGIMFKHLYCESCEAEGHVGACEEAYELFYPSEDTVKESGWNGYRNVLQYWHQAVTHALPSSNFMRPPCNFEVDYSILGEDREFCGENDPNTYLHWVAGPNFMTSVEDRFSAFMATWGFTDPDLAKLTFCSSTFDFWIADPVTPPEYRTYHHFCGFCGGLEMTVCEGDNIFWSPAGVCLDGNTFAYDPNIVSYQMVAPTCDNIKESVDAALQPIYPLPACHLTPYACQDLDAPGVCADPAEGRSKASQVPTAPRATSSPDNTKHRSLYVA